MELGELQRTPKGWEETAPQVCGKCGHELAGMQVLVGHQPCRCDQRGGHRSWRCRACGEPTFAPPLGEQCRPLIGAG